MAIEVKVPDMGESVIEATIARWLKQEGERVAPGEPVVELETDKINLEVGAQQAGVLERIQKLAGETVNVGDILAWVAEGDGGGSVSTQPQVQAASPDAPQAKAEKPQPSSMPQAAPLERLQSTAQNQPAGQDETPAENQRGEESQPQPAAGMPTITPVAARMAQDLGIDLSQVRPSAGGRITREDVEAYAASHKGDSGSAAERTQPAAGSSQPAAGSAQPAAGSAQPAAGSAQPAAVRPISANQGGTPYQGSTEQHRGPDTGAATVQPKPPASSPTPAANGQGPLETRVRLSRRRQTIAKRLVEAQHTAAMLTTFNEIDMSKVMDLRKRRREGFKERFGVDLGFMSFFVKASVAALKAFPNVNAELQTDELVLKQYYDIGIAVGAEEGLVVPVIRGADRLNFAGIEKAVKDLAEKARSGALTLDDLRGGTFTITNGGIYGSLMSTPILNPPQVGILGMHAIKERAVVVNGEIVARPMMYVALSYDHRVVDGSEAVRFLVRIKEMIEDPESLLFG